MKYKFIKSILTFLLLSCTVYSQNISFTLRATGGSESKAKVFVRSNAAKSGVVSQVILTFLLPASVVPTPTATVVPLGNFSHLGTFDLQPIFTQEVNGINYAIFTFANVYVGAINSTFAENTEYEFAEVTFNFAGQSTSELRLAYLPNGGNSGLAGLALELGGNQILNEAAMVYGPLSFNAGSPAGFSFVGINVVLPVEFKGFYALKSGDDAKLTWDVSSDENNKHFEVMRSIDGRNFKTIETIKALNNGRSDNSYETKDFSISKLGSREIFYQIKQVDKDGTITNSPVRKLSVDGLGKSVSAYPNPAANTTKVKVDATEAGQGNLIMRDGMGRQVRLLNAQFHRGINLFDMNLMGLASGEYTIQVNGGGVNESIKLTKVQ